MSILYWQTPKKVMTTDEWRAISADSAPEGVYAPNMSKTDMERWKAKRIGGDDRRVEVRKTLGGTQMLLVVRPDGSVRMSMNQGALFSASELIDMWEAVAEARLDLRGA